MRSPGELVLFGALLIACNAGEDEVIASGTDGSSGASLGTDESGDVCDTDPEPPIDGEWSEEIEDWTDPGDPGLELINAPCVAVTSDDVRAPGAIAAHHCFTTAVHAVHMRTGELLVFHGEQDERAWQVGSNPEAIDWHPVPYNTDVEVVFQGAWTPAIREVDLFCSGHAVLGDGRVLIAGGNIDGSPSSGGLAETFLFEPLAASAASDPVPICPFGWALADEGGEWTNLSPRMAYDRWYPTLTLLGDGRVLIAGGTSRVEDHDPVTFRPAGAAATTRYLELYDPTSSPPTMTTLDNEEALYPVEEGVPVYPYVFLLPNGDLVFAGAESTEVAGQADGYILLPDYGNVQNWAFAADPGQPTEPLVIDSTIPGGSAAMFRPGLIIKSGGGGAPEPTTEILDLRGFAAGDYDDAPTQFEPVMDMHHARHYHTMTLLPDGRVLATGGNSQGNGDPTDPGHHYNNPCAYEQEPIDQIECDGGCSSVCIDYGREFSPAGGVTCDPDEEDLTCSLIRHVECVPGMAGDAFCDGILDGATCASDGDAENHCTRACSEIGEDCGLVQDCAVSESREVEPDVFVDFCTPLNNECYATHAAEVFDPGCETWTELGEQDYPRMYHSSALLLRDGRVISMGGGHRGYRALAEQPISEYFEPQYAENPAAERPDFGFGFGGLAPVGGQLLPFLRWGNEGIDVVVQPAAEVVVDHASLIRLGSVTHGFDMDQRYLELPITGSWPEYHVSPSAAAFHRNTAPPGWYMLFLISDEGEPSLGQYIQVGDDTSPMYLCEASGDFAAVEASCDEEPDQGDCPGTGEVGTPVDAPLVEGPSSTVNGFRVVVPAGIIRDDEFQTLTDEEETIVRALCATACTEYYESHLGQSANCDDADAFETPVVVTAAADRALDLIPPAKRNGWGLFVGQQLDCDLGTECYADFDESLRMTIPSRVTPAQDMLSVGEEWRVTVSGELQADSSQAIVPGAASITGTVGYSECTAGNASDPCPFYLGSMELSLTEPLLLELSCDGLPYVYELEELTVRLGQPAFGIAKEAQAVRGFGPGALILESEGVVNNVPFTTRRPTQDHTIYTVASGGWISMLGTYGAWLDLELPCPGEEAAAVDLWWEFEAVAWPGKPPSIEIDVPATVSCPDTIDLDYTATDNNGDIESVRWLVDGVLMAESVTTLDFTESHELTAIVRDSRGATRTDVETVSCQ